MIRKEIKNNQLYLYMNGRLIFKRWLLENRSVTFDLLPYDKTTYKTIK